MSQRDPITEILMRPFAEEEIESRKIGGGRMASYVAGETVIRRLIEATGNQYGVAVREIQRHPWPDREDKKTGELVPQILWTAIVTVTIPELGLPRDHLGVQVSDQQAGAEDVIKGVITDGLKKAATLFGVALQLYDKPMQQSDDQKGKSNPLMEWRKRVGEVAKKGDPEGWKALLNDAGKEGFRWVEIIAQVPTIRQLERLAQVAADNDMFTSAVETKLTDRRKQLEKQGPPAGK